MIKKTIMIDDKPIEFRASASVPRLYRFKFGRDIFVDIDKLQRVYIKNKTEGENFETIDLEIFENVAYIMARHADPENTPDTPDEWLEQFNMLSIYLVLPELLHLWGLNIESQSESKKKLSLIAEA